MSIIMKSLCEERLAVWAIIVEGRVKTVPRSGVPLLEFIADMKEIGDVFVEEGLAMMLVVIGLINLVMFVEWYLTTLVCLDGRAF